MKYHEIPCNAMQYHAIPCNTMQYHAIPCTTMQYHVIQCNTMQNNAMPCNAVQYQSIVYLSNQPNRIFQLTKAFKVTTPDNRDIQEELGRSQGSGVCRRQYLCFGKPTQYRRHCTSGGSGWDHNHQHTCRDQGKVRQGLTHPLGIFRNRQIPHWIQMGVVDLFP